MKFLITLLIVMITAACGRFDFASLSVQQGRVPLATFLSLEGASSLGLGGCTPLAVKAWAKTGVPGAVRHATLLVLGGLRSSDTLYLDASCRSLGDRGALSLAAGATSVEFYVRAGTLGQLALELSSSNFETVRKASSVELVATRLAYSSGASGIEVPAGFCFGPIAYEVRDANGNPFTAASQDVQIAGGEGLVFSDAACNNAIPDAKLSLKNTRNGNFYVRRGAVTAQTIPFALKDPNREFIAGDVLGIAFVSAPYQVKISGGPASGRLVLGACDATPYRIELRDVEGTLAGPRSGSMRVDLGSVPDAPLITYRTACGAMGVVITSLSFAPGEVSKNVFLESRSRTSVTARAWVSVSPFPILEHRAVIPVDAVPLAIALNGPTTVTAGTLSSAFTVALLDGLGAEIAAPSTVVIALSGAALGNDDKVCSMAPCASNLLAMNRLTVAAGSSRAAFYYQANPEATAGARALLASAVNASLTPDTFLVTIGERLPSQLRIGGGPGDGMVDLGVCEAVPYTVELLDANGLSVDPPTASSLTVNLNFASGAGQFRSSCGGAATTAVVFSSGQVSKSIYITAQARNSVTLRAQAGGLTQATLAVAVNTVPVKVGLSGPQSLRAGIPAGPYLVSLLDGLNAPISAGAGGEVAEMGLPAAVKGSYCTAASCATTEASLNLSISPGQSSASFYLLSDANSSLSNQGLTATPDNSSLQSATLALALSRDSLSVDPNFGSSGRVISSLPGYDGGEVLASVYFSGKALVAGYQTNGSAKRFAVGRYRADRSQGLGALDPAFNGNGFNVLNLGEESWASAVAVQGANTLVAGVQRTAASGHDVVLVRFRDNGTPDPAFRMSGGVPVPLSLPGDQFATAVLVGGDGTIYVVGYADPEVPSGDNTADIFVAAFQSNGAPIANGVAYHDVGVSEDLAKCAVLQAFGAQDRITLGGSSGSASSKDIFVARLLGVRGVSAASVLSLDPSFGGGSPVVQDWGSLGDTLEAMAVQPSGRVIAVGSRDGLTSSQTVLMGLTASGSLDSSFASNGLSFTDIGLISNERLTSVASDPSTGAIYAVGIAGNDLLAMRYGADGRSDGLSPSYARYSVSGNPAETARSVIFGQDSKPLVSGSANGDWAVYQLLR